MVADGRLKPGARLPTEPELAKQFGVSSQTVRQAKLALTKTGLLVSTRKKGTFVTAEAMLTRVAILWQADILTGESGGLRVVVRQLEMQCRNKMIFHHFATWTGEDSSRASLDSSAGELKEYRPAAVLVVGKVLEIEDRCRRDGIPLIGLHKRTGMPFVGMDMGSCADLGVDYLVKQGIKDIGMIGGLGAMASFENTRTWHRAKWPSGWCVEATRGLAQSAEVEEFGHEAFKKIWQIHRHPKGLIILDDVMLKGAVLAMAELGVKPGRDIRVVSHFNKNSRLYVPAEFVKLEIDTAQYAAEAARLIESVVANPKANPVAVLLKPKLVI